jgi:hypothetical protein
VSALNHELFEQPEKTQPPSQAGDKQFKTFKNAQAEDAGCGITYDEGALAFNAFDRHRNVKWTLQEYIQARSLFGLPKVTRYSEVTNHSKRALLNTVDFCCDVDIAAKQAFRGRPVLLKLFTVLVNEELGKRVSEFAEKHPRVWFDMLKLLGSELRKRKITSRSEYFYGGGQ